MTKWIKLGIIFFIVAVAAGCSKPKIDASTDELLLITSDKLRESVPEQKRADFDQALNVWTSQLVEDDGNSGAVTVGQSLETDIRYKLNGKTTDEIISGAKIMAAEELKKIEIISYELNEFNPSYEFNPLNKASIEEIEEFGVMHYEFISYDAGSRVPVFDVTFKNSSNYPIYSIYFEVVVTTPEYSIPYFNDSFGYPMPDGLEPGGIQRVTWANNPSSLWFNNPLDIKSKDGFKFTVDNVAIQGGVNGNTLYRKPKIED